jgi:hypothetical protein
MVSFSPLAAFHEGWTKACDTMRANAAPASQFQRLGFPETGAVGPEHLAIER